MNINHQVAEVQASRQDQAVTRLRDLLDQVFRQNHSRFSPEQLHFCEGPPWHSRAPQPTCLDKAPRLSINYLDLGIWYYLSAQPIQYKKWGGYAVCTCSWFMSDFHDQTFHHIGDSVWSWCSGGISRSRGEAEVEGEGEESAGAGGQVGARLHWHDHRQRQQRHTCRHLIIIMIIQVERRPAHGENQRCGTQPAGSQWHCVADYKYWKGWLAIAKLKPLSLFISLFQHCQMLS